MQLCDLSEKCTVSLKTLILHLYLAAPIRERGGHCNSMVHKRYSVACGGGLKWQHQKEIGMSNYPSFPPIRVLSNSPLIQSIWRTGFCSSKTIKRSANWGANWHQTAPGLGASGNGPSSKGPFQSAFPAAAAPDPSRSP